MSKHGHKTGKSRLFLRLLSNLTIISGVIGGGCLTGYYTAQYFDRSESLITKFANIQIRSKLQVGKKEKFEARANISHLNKTNQIFFAKTDVMMASDALLVAAQKSENKNQQATLAANKSAYIHPKPQVIVSASSPDYTHSLKPYPLPDAISKSFNAQTIVIEPASLNLSKESDSGSARISLRASIGEQHVEKKVAALPPKKIAPLSLMTREKFRASTEARRLAAEKHCLSQAIYFEARGEPSLGQMAVANVVMNRVRSRHYPNTVCGVVFQGEERRHKCQFSFACDGKTDRPRKDKHWRRAERIASQIMKGRKRIRALDNSLHYHADYVRPRWSRKMNRVKKIGRHIFFHDKSLREKG